MYQTILRPEKQALILEKMRSANLGPDTRAYTIFMQTCNTVGDYESAKKAWERMKEEGWVPDFLSLREILTTQSKLEKV